MMNMPKVKMIVFDMDGTIADLYSVAGWLEKLRAYDPAPYREATPMWNMDELADILKAVRAEGITINVVTWLSKESTPEYDKAVREAKRAWLAEHGFPYDHFHGVKYGSTKADSVRKYLNEDETAILFDDAEKIRKGWHLGQAFDPATTDILDVLRGLVE